MRRIRTGMTIGLAAALLVASAAASAQGRGAGSRGWGPQGAYGRLFDPKTLTTVSGKVARVERVRPMEGMGRGVHLVLETTQGLLAVHLGPAWYLDRQDTQIAAGDAVGVTGSRVRFEGTPALIATQVRRGDEVLTLRDASGFPVWAGWTRRAQP